MGFGLEESEENTTIHQQQQQQQHAERSRGQLMMESEFDRQGERSTVYYWTVHVPTVMLHWSFTSVFSEAFLVGMDHNNNQPIIDHT